MPSLKYGWAFMIAYNVNVGAFISETIPVISNISDFTFLDKNRPFALIESNNGEFSNILNITLDEIYSNLENIFGKDANTIYGAFSVSNSPQRLWSDIDKIVVEIPSLTLAYPNTNAFIRTNPDNNNTYVFYYFPGLKKFIISGSGLSAATLYNVEENGNLVRFNTSNALNSISNQVNTGTRRYGGAFEGFYIYNYLTPSDIIKNWAVFTPRFTSESSAAILSFTNSGYKTLIEFLFTNAPEPDWVYKPDNPFEPLPPSQPDTPGGKFDDQSDIIGDSSLPSLSASDTGFTRIYIPTLSQVQGLARYLWTDETVVETIWNKIKQFFENPMEAIIGFNLVPVPVPSSGTKSFALMYIDTGVSMDTAASQFVDVDCGTFKLEYYYGSALDYSPYTKVSCFLPYIGMVQLNTDEVMNRTLQIKYRVDIVSGSCVAKILVDGNCIYQYSGHCAITIPISASDFTSYVSAAISVAKLAVGAAVGGAGAALSALAGAPAASQQTNQVVTQTQTETAHYNAEGAFTGASITNRTQTRESPKNQSSTESSFAGLTPANISNTVGEIMGSKPHVQHSGSFSGNSGYLGVRRPFLIIERPNLCLPENYQQLNGFPAMITMLLGECSGYTRVQQVELTGLPATNPEQAEILELLKSGVIF